MQMLERQEQNWRFQQKRGGPTCGRDVDKGGRGRGPGRPEPQNAGKASNRASPVPSNSPLETLIGSQLTRFYWLFDWAILQGMGKMRQKFC